MKREAGGWQVTRVLANESDKQTIKLAIEEEKKDLAS
jgi:hypothetical protein